MSDAARNPTAVRRELGQRLRALRQGTELTVVQAAEQVGISPSKVTKIELAQLAATRDDVLKMLDAYGETDTEQQALLLSMVREGKRKDWWEGHRALRPKFASYLGLESVATTLPASTPTWCTGYCRPPTTLTRCYERCARTCWSTRSTSSCNSGYTAEILTRADPPC